MRFAATSAVAAVAVAFASCSSFQESPKRACFALELDGMSSYVDVPPAAELDPDGPSTIEAWIYLSDDTRAPQEIVSHHDHDGNVGYLLLLMGNGTQDPNPKDPAEIGAAVRYYDGASPIFTNQVGFGKSSLVTPRKWTHLAGVYDGQNVRLYVDGFLKGEKAAPIAPANAPYGGPLRIGAGSETLRFFFGGRIDELRISRVARYQGRSFLVPLEDFEPDDATIGLWHFDEGEGITTADTTGRLAGRLQSGAKFVPVDCGPRQ